MKTVITILEIIILLSTPTVVGLILWKRLDDKSREKNIYYKRFKK